MFNHGQTNNGSNYDDFIDFIGNLDSICFKTLCKRCFIVNTVMHEFGINKSKIMARKKVTFLVCIYTALNTGDFTIYEIFIFAYNHFVAKTFELARRSNFSE